jgi:phosphoglycolate phosphatase-like HAD superfamily hydrolase
VQTEPGPRQVPGDRERQLIALDLDGTLIDARPRQVGVASEALATFAGEILDEERFWQAKLAGASTVQALEALGHPSDMAAEVGRLWAQRIESLEWLRQDRALDGARQALEGLRGTRIAVLTARRSSQGARLSLACAGLEDLVEELFVVDPMAAAAGKAGILSERRPAVFIGDTESDGEAARRAGVRFRAVATGQRSRAYLQSRGYDPLTSLHAALDGVLSVSGVSERICQP